LYPTRIEVVADDALLTSHVRLLDRDQVSYDWQHYIPLIERKPGALRNGAPFADPITAGMTFQAVLELTQRRWQIGKGSAVAQRAGLAFDQRDVVLPVIADLVAIQ
jgi:hypothetical protein